MQTMTVEEAQSHLAEILEKMPPGEKVVLTRDGSTSWATTRPDATSIPSNFPSSWSGAE